MSTSPNERLITRREAVALVRQELGIPIALSTFQEGKRKMNKGLPPLVARYGQRHLYRPDEVLEWAKNLPVYANDNAGREEEAA